MAASNASPLSWLLLLLTLTSSALVMSLTVSAQDRKAYIVYMGEPPKNTLSVSAIQMSVLRKVIGSNTTQDTLLHSYKRSFNGFVVMLTEDEMKTMSGMDGVISVFPNEKKKLHTTRSWDFMGFSQQVNRAAAVESDVIIGVLDSGIWPESESFSDLGYGPPPIKWMGTCEASFNFTCNNKIIGAKSYRSDGLFGPEDLASPRDSDGHGTHTASTAAGNAVAGASLSGLASGTARGGVPSARIAVYKICWSDGCSDADILAAFDDAIADGVDIISLSVGGSIPKRYFEDSIAIGAFHAMKNGVLTSNSAGNDGPGLGTITNFSPWSLSVAASTIDRKFFTKVLLGNGMVYQGVSINTFDLSNGMYPMIYGGDAPNITGGFLGSISRFCTENSLDSSLVKGKIVLCDSLDSGKGPFYAGAAGLVMRDQGPKDFASSFPLPASYIGVVDGNNIFIYMKLSGNSTATILKSNESNDTLAPYVASFSSRGPNQVTLDILKPDLAAPGVDILAAWSPISSVSEEKGDTRSVPFNIISGTSMACPHATAVAAYVKSFHPTWSPAAIKSALMTTANPMSIRTNSDAEFAYGAGHLNPIKAANPGLIYDADKTDYIKFLCGQGYTPRSLQLVTGENTTCSAAINATVWDLNYPSFAISTSPLQPINAVFHRTVTNVGSPTSTYKATVSAPLGLNISVSPSILGFSYLGQKLGFEVSVEGRIRDVVSGSLVWDDGVGGFKVRSPIVVFAVVVSQHA